MGASRKGTERAILPILSTLYSTRQFLLAAHTGLKEKASGFQIERPNAFGIQKLASWRLLQVLLSPIAQASTVAIIQ
jgi:hypothetical protein